MTVCEQITHLLTTAHLFAMRVGGNSLKKEKYIGGLRKSEILNGSVFESNVRKKHITEVADKDQKV